ncbi:MAG: S8 family peptidase [Agathobacter sp.]|nr:S8 family peptidase [Agathobacter sp.]
MQRVKKEVQARQVYRNGFTGRGIRIALVDTGVAPLIGLRNRIVYFKDYINGKRTAYDDNGHGTHIAGILCGGLTSDGEILGMAPLAELFVFKILDKNGNGSTQKAIWALEWLEKNHKKYNIRILNFSMGYLSNAKPRLQKVLIDKLEKLWDEGMIVVTAAGNNGPKENSITVPGVSRKVITVGSSDDVYVTAKSYSGRGPTECCIVKPEILAPGTAIKSYGLKEGEYVNKSGTSMSVPIVCGALALALEKNPDLSPPEMKMLLYDTVSEKIKNLSPSWGILDVDNLIKML